MQNEKQAVQRQHKAEHKSHNPERIEILYQDQYIAVIDKPAGLLSVPYPGSKTKTAQSVLEELLRKHGAANTRDAQALLIHNGYTRMSFATGGLITLQTDGTKWIVRQDIRPDMVEIAETYRYPD